MKTLDEIAGHPLVKVLDRSDDPSNYGMSFMTVRSLERIAVIVGVDEVSGWEHVSVSCEHRIPSWNEMNYVKRLCFHENEVAFQLHPAEDNYINTHPNVLHIWRNKNYDPPLPPLWMV